MIEPLSQPQSFSQIRGAFSITEPFDPATLYPPLLAHSTELCRRFGLPDHLAEDFLQEMWLRSFRREPWLGRDRDEVYVYLRRRLLGCFQDRNRSHMRHLTDALVTAELPIQLEEE